MGKMALHLRIREKLLDLSDCRLLRKVLLIDTRTDQQIEQAYQAWQRLRTQSGYCRVYTAVSDVAGNDFACAYCPLYIVDIDGYSRCMYSCRTAGYSGGAIEAWCRLQYCTMQNPGRITAADALHVLNQLERVMVYDIFADIQQVKNASLRHTLLCRVAVPRIFDIAAVKTYCNSRTNQ